MSVPAMLPNFGSGFGFGSGFPSAAVPMYMQPGVTHHSEREEPVLAPNNLQAYLIALSAINFVGTGAAQRILAIRGVSDFQEASGVSFPGRLATGVLFTIPLVVTYQSVTSDNAKNRMLRMCNVPLDLGEGDMKEPMFYYNTTTDTCASFSYKGSKGNANRFPTKDKCEITCRPYTEEGRAALKRKITLAQTVSTSVELTKSLFGEIPAVIYAVALEKEIELDML